LWKKKPSEIEDEKSICMKQEFKADIVHGGFTHEMKIYSSRLDKTLWWW